MYTFACFETNVDIGFNYNEGLWFCIIYTNVWFVTAKYWKFYRKCCNQSSFCPESFLWTTKAIFVETFAGLQYDKYTIDHVTFLIPVHVTRAKQARVKTTTCCCWFSLYFVFIAMTVNLMTKMQRISLFIQSFSKIYVYVTTGARLNYFIRLTEEYAYILNDSKVLIISVN
jgi:hypothetical protein